MGRLKCLMCRRMQLGAYNGAKLILRPGEERVSCTFRRGIGRPAVQGVARKKRQDIPKCGWTLVNRHAFPDVQDTAVGSRVRELGCVLVDSGDAGALSPAILVVESDPAARDVLLEHLQARGFSITESEHGGAAIRTAAAQPFDYAVVDIDWVGVSDGAALARWMRTNRPQTRLFLSSTVLSHLFPAGSTMAALPLIRKPFRKEDLDRVFSPAAVPATAGA